MTIDFVVEDGTGLADATSYISEDEMRQDWFNKGQDFDSLNDSDIQRLLNDSTAYIDNSYRESFPGSRATDVQSLEWGRFGAYYLDGFEIDEGVVPPEIKKAVSEMAYLISTGTNPEETIDKSGKVIAESSKVDVIAESFTYSEGSVLYQDIYTSVDNILSRITGGVSDNFKLTVLRVGGDSA